MGQKINPISLRLQTTNRYFDSCWYNDFYYTESIEQDFKVRHYLNSILKQLHYPAGRFFIQSSHKKIKIYQFFCSPLKARRIRAFYFRTKYYRISKGTLLSKKNKLTKYLPKKELNVKKEKKVFHFIKNKNLNKNQSFYLKYILFQKYLQNIYGQALNQLISSTSQNLILEKRQKQPYITSTKVVQQYLNAMLKTLSSIQGQNKRKNRVGQKQLRHQSIRDNGWNQQKKKRYGIVSTILLEKPFAFFSYTNHYLDLSSFLDYPCIYLSKVQINKKAPLFTTTRDWFLGVYRYFGKLSYHKHIATTLGSYSNNLKIGVPISLYSNRTYDHFRSAHFLADEIIYYIERRVPFHRIKMKIMREIQGRSRIQGLRISCSGRVGGRSKKAQRAKSDAFKYGQTSLHVFSSQIDFISKKALTRFGLVGVKVWICYKG